MSKSKHDLTATTIAACSALLSDLDHADREHALVALVLVAETDAGCSDVDVHRLTAMMEAITDLPQRTPTGIPIEIPTE